MQFLLAPNREAPLMMEATSDPRDLREARAQREQFDRNLDWFEAHAMEIGDRNRGKYVCIAGQQLFVADSAREALRLGREAYPDDLGPFVRYIACEKVPWIYAH